MVAIKIQNDHQSHDADSVVLVLGGPYLPIATPRREAEIGRSVADRTNSAVTSRGRWSWLPGQGDEGVDRSQHDCHGEARRGLTGAQGLSEPYGMMGR